MAASASAVVVVRTTTRRIGVNLIIMDVGRITVDILGDIMVVGVVDHAVPAQTSFGVCAVMNGAVAIAKMSMHVATTWTVCIKEEKWCKRKATMDGADRDGGHRYSPNLHAFRIANYISEVLLRKC